MRMCCASHSHGVKADEGLAGDFAKPTLIGALQPFDEALRFQPMSLRDIIGAAQFAPHHLG